MMSLRLPMLAGLFLTVAMPVMVPGAAPADADAGSRTPPRQVLDGQTPKNCTRINSRFGYYANQWCTPAEQLAWDRWEAKRLRAGR